MTPRTLRRFCKLDAESEKQMENAITKLGLSARAYDRILKGRVVLVAPALAGWGADPFDPGQR